MTISLPIGGSRKRKLRLPLQHSEVEKPATVEPSELASDDEAPVQEQWKCEEATVWAPLSSNKITETVITEKWDNNREQKLVNEFNAANLGMIGGRNQARKPRQRLRHTKPIYPNVLP